MENSEWIVLIYLVLSMGVLGMLAIGLLIDHDSGEASYVTETDQSEVEPSGSVVESTINENPFEGFDGIFGSFDGF